MFFARIFVRDIKIDWRNHKNMGNSMNVNQIQTAVVDRFKAISLTADENGVLRIRSFSDGGAQLAARMAQRNSLNVHNDHVPPLEEHRFSFDSVQRTRFTRTSCTTIPEEEIVSFYAFISLDSSFFFLSFPSFFLWVSEICMHIECASACADCLRVMAGYIN